MVRAHGGDAVGFLQSVLAMSDLTKRLRSLHRDLDQLGPYQRIATFRVQRLIIERREAAARIEELEAVNEELRRAIERLRAEG